MNTTQPQPVNGAVRPTAALAVGGVAIAVALASIVALGGFGGRGGNAGVIVPPPVASPSTPAVTPRPSDRPTPSPATSPLPSPAATPEPPDGGSDAMPTRVDLATATGADVYVDIVDRTGLLAGAVSGTPGDGASVEGYTVAVENLDPVTLRLTWIDLPIDNALALYIDRADGHLRLLLIQPEPTTASDAIGFDRELVLTFSEPVSAGSVETFLQGGLDT